ncbi:hypothetical protein [Sphingomonas echinoides]|uniref:hypothetical protein n=1 Tax=Sphingomonas echinoides TaxID=59803 RepID=UPI00241328E6|nr:hypothetical protein [Sphingomonas echinoides]
MDFDNAVARFAVQHDTIRQADLTACKRMIARLLDQFGILKGRLAADIGYCPLCVIRKHTVVAN